MSLNFTPKTYDIFWVLSKFQSFFLGIQISYDVKVIPCSKELFVLRNFQRKHPKTAIRVAADLENLEKSGNLKETSESRGICLKSQGICNRIPKVKEFSCLKFIFSQVEDPNF